MSFYLLWNTKEEILTKVGYPNILVTTDFHCMEEKKSDVSQNIFLYSTE